MSGSTFPSDFDDSDRSYADSLVPDGSFITAMMTIVGFMDSDGTPRWRCYNATIDTRVAECLGLIELAKLDMVARGGTGLPIEYADPDDDDTGEG